MSAANIPRSELHRKYVKVRHEKKERIDTAENEVLVTSTRVYSKYPAPYVRRALLLLNGPQKKEKEEEKKEEEKKEKEEEKAVPSQTYRTIKIMGRGRGVQTVVKTAEILKREVKGLHQDSKLEMQTVTDTWKPKGEEGGEEVTTERVEAWLHITLSLDELDTAAYGYQAPLPEDQVVPVTYKRQKPVQKPKEKKKKEEEKKKAIEKIVGRGGGRGGGAAAAPVGRGGGRGAAAASAPVGRGGNRTAMPTGRGGGVVARGRGKK